MADQGGRGSRRRIAAWALALAAAGLGIPAAGGALLALKLEVDGFGRPRDSALRPGYIMLLMMMIAGGLLLPTVLAAWVTKPSARAAVTVAGCAVTLTTLLIGAVILGVRR